VSTTIKIVDRAQQIFIIQHEGILLQFIIAKKWRERRQMGYLNNLRRLCSRDGGGRQAGCYCCRIAGSSSGAAAGWLGPLPALLQGG
jgi:hypothetical protein